jgi:hypothetical protein
MAMRAERTSATSAWSSDVAPSLTAEAHVLQTWGQRSLAARALGRASPFRDNFVDVRGNAQSRLSDNNGAAEAMNLMD